MAQLPAVAHRVGSSCVPTPQRIINGGFAGNTVPIEDQIYGMILPRQGFPAPRAVAGKSRADAIRLAPVKATPGVGKPILGWFRSVITGQAPPPDPKWVEVKAKKWGILHRPGVPDQRVYIIGRRSSSQGMYVQVSLHPIGYMGGDDDCGGPCPDHSDGMGGVCKGFCNCSQAAAMGRPECFCDWDCGTVSARPGTGTSAEDCIDFYDEYGRYTHSVCGPGDIAVIDPWKAGKDDCPPGTHPCPTPAKCCPDIAFPDGTRRLPPHPLPMPIPPKRVARPTPGPLPPVPPPPPTPRAAKKARVTAIKAGIAGYRRQARSRSRCFDECAANEQCASLPHYLQVTCEAKCRTRCAGLRAPGGRPGARPARRAILAGGSDYPPSYPDYPGNPQRRDVRARHGWAGGSNRPPSYPDYPGNPQRRDARVRRGMAGGSDAPPTYPDYPGNPQRREARRGRGMSGGSMYPPSYPDYPGKQQRRDAGRGRSIAGGCGGACGGKCNGSCGNSCSCKK